MKRQVLPNIRVLAITTLVLMTLLVPAATVGFPHLYRWRMLQGLTHDNPDRLSRSLGYLSTHADDDPRVLRAGIQALRIADDDRFPLIATALEAAGHWDRSTVGNANWLRWIGRIIDRGDPAGRIAAAGQLASMPDAADQPALHHLLERLATDPDPDIRINALVAAAELASVPPRAPDRLTEQIITATDDPNPQIARHAWLFAGLLNIAPPPPATLPADPAVAEALLWACPDLTTHPRDTAPWAASDDLLAAAVHAASRLPESPLADALCRAPLPDQPTHALWRALLITRDLPAIRAIANNILATHRDDPAWEPLLLAACFRLGTPTYPTPDHPDDRTTVRRLAGLEGAAERTVHLDTTRPMPTLLRIAAVRVAATGSPSDLRPVLIDPVPTLRDLACLVAIRRFDADQLAPLIGELLNDYNDHAKQSGALLAGLTGHHLATVRHRYNREDNPAVRVVMRLALWLGGDQRILDPAVARSLLSREELGIGSTILFAMLHRGRDDPAAAREALDHLLNPRGDPNIDLPQLLDTFRWWFILDDALPLLFDQPHPPLWLWADPPLQRLQIDILRNWYLVHRHRLTVPATSP